MLQPFLLSLLKPLASIASGIGKPKKLSILIYHRVLDQPDYMRPDEIDKVIFSWHMQLLANYFNVLPLSEALERMHADTLPPRAVCITFDDGYADNLINALPILKQFDLTATFFIASGFLNGGRMWNDTVIEAVRNMQTATLDLTEIDLGLLDIADDTRKSLAAQQIIRQIKHLPIDKRQQYADFIATKSQNLPNHLMMTTEQLITLSQSGVEIGGHTVTHPILAKLDDAAATQEIQQNKAFLESVLNKPIRLFAYPNGKPNLDYQPQQIEFVQQAGYQAAVSTVWGVADRNSDSWQLPRFTPWDKSPEKFMLRMIKNYFSSKNSNQ